MKNKQQAVIWVWSILILIVALFPSLWEIRAGSGPGGSYGGYSRELGHSFVFEGSFWKGRPYLVDTGRLLAYWGIVTAFAVMAWMVVSRKQ